MTKIGHIDKAAGSTGNGGGMSGERGETRGYERGSRENKYAVFSFVRGRSITDWLSCMSNSWMDGWFRSLALFAPNLHVVIINRHTMPLTPCPSLCNAWVRVKQGCADCAGPYSCKSHQQSPAIHPHPQHLWPALVQMSYTPVFPPVCPRKCCGLLRCFIV